LVIRFISVRRDKRRRSEFRVLNAARNTAETDRNREDYNRSIKQLAPRMPEMKFSLLETARITAWFLAAVITVLSLVPPQLRPDTGAPHNLEHFAIFFADGAAFGFGYYRRPLIVIVAVVVFAGIIELAQLFVPGRHARLSDFMVDAVALCVGVVMASPVAARTFERSV
jgi:VanZ family protein